MASRSSAVVVHLFKTISHVSDDCFKVYKIISHCLVLLADSLELSIISLVYFVLNVLLNIQQTTQEKQNSIECV